MAPTTKPRRKRARKARTAAAHLASSSSSSSSSSSAAASSSSSSESESQDEGVGSSKVVSREERMKQSMRMQLDSDDSSSSSSSAASGNDDSGDEDDDDEVPSVRTRRPSSPVPEPAAEYAEDERDRIAASDVDGLLEARMLRFMPTAAGSGEVSDLLQRQAGARKAAREEMLRNRGDQGLDIPTEVAQRSEEGGAEQFQSFWMENIVEQFGEELDAIRKKDPLLNGEDSSRYMALFIDALQSGSELYSRGPASAAYPAAPQLHAVDEVALLLQARKVEGA